MLVSTKASLQLLAMVSCCISGGSSVDSQSIDGRFYYYDDPQTFTNATTSCEAMGMELATATTKADYQSLMSFSRENRISFWIGLQFNDTENGYQWIDGTFMDVINWQDPYIPYTVKSWNECAYIHVNNQQKNWNTDSCSEEKHYICVDFSPVPVYMYGSDNVTHSEAQQRCLQNKSTLPIIITKIEETRLNDFLVSLGLPENEELWIGLYRDDTDGEYKWMNGEELADFHKWYGPNYFLGDQYVFVHRGFHLHSVSSNSSKTYMCQNNTINGQTKMYYDLEVTNAYPLNSPRKEIQVNTRTECAGYCSRDNGCLKFTLDGSNCTTYGPVVYTRSTGGLYLYKRL